ncbi:hypothetical protein PFLUOLIPICF7_07345 [Pseudomonas simiae]|nr:hypothetical protein PFLUOLIPICF7_07345 [Pseudomonas simiae]
MPIFRENRSIHEELFVAHERWRGNALSATATIDRAKQNVLDALSGNLELFWGGFPDSTNQPLTIGALQKHNLGEATFAVTGLFHNDLQGISRCVTGELNDSVK